MILRLQNELKKYNIVSFFNESSFKDYMARLTLVPNDTLLVYYKPTKNTYSLKKQLRNSKVDNIVDFVWNRINGCEIYPIESGVYEAFVDGSYISETTGYGAVIYLGNDIKAELLGTVSSTHFRQFGGELQSVIETIKWCENNGVKSIRINYDYIGIENFATGKWKARNAFSKKYVDFLLKTKIEIEWRHIKSHTGNKKNDRADCLAKKAITATTNKPFKTS
jgi:ribonuclease HI